MKSWASPGFFISQERPYYITVQKNWLSYEIKALRAGCTETRTEVSLRDLRFARKAVELFKIEENGN